MSLLRVPVAGLASGRMALDEAAAHYVARVHRLGPGDEFVAFDPSRQLEAAATVVEVRRARVTCDIGELHAASAIQVRPLWLLAGLTKSDAFEWTIREATALGATDIVPVICARTTVPAPEAASRRLERWRRIVVEGARQCGRGDTPTIHGAMGLTEAVRCGPGEALRLCLWERAERPIREVVGAGIDAAAVVVLVGPEGGLERGEVEIATRAGFATVLFGQLVLRAETAAIAALGLVRGLWCS